MAKRAEKSKRAEPTGRTTRSRSSAVASMTGFGRAERRTRDVSYVVEIRGVNNRFLDIVTRMPRSSAAWEEDVRTQVASCIARGRVEVTVTRTATSRVSASRCHFDRTLFGSLFEVYREVLGREQAEAQRAAITMALLERREVLFVDEEERAPDSERALFRRALAAALDAFAEMRRAEGARLAQDIQQRLQQLRRLRKELQERADAALPQMRTRLLSRIERLAPEVLQDQQRIASEVALLTDKSDVTEELVRLDSHFDQFMTLAGQGRNGRKLDFLVQEIGREFNTIGAKAQDASMQQLVVDAKAELERIREQLQNIE